MLPAGQVVERNAADELLGMQLQALQRRLAQATESLALGTRSDTGGGGGGYSYTTLEATRAEAKRFRPFPDL